MAINEEDRQLALAGELEALARTLAHSTRNVPNPQDSYALIGELRSTVGHLTQVLKQLGSWHKNAVEGKHYAGIDAEGYFTPGIEITDERRAQFVQFDVGVSLETAAAELWIAESTLGQAHTASGAVRWYGTPQG